MNRFRFTIVIIAFFCFHEAKSNEFTSPVSLREWTSVSPDRNRENPDSLKTLDINHAHVTIRAKGSLFYDGEGMSEYFVPADSGTAIIRTASIWIGGYDENNELHISGEIYNKRDTETAYDYYPGPLMIQGSENPGQCDQFTGSLFNRVWKIDRKDIERIRATDPSTLSIDNIPKDILEWPAHGPEGYDNTLAPFIDRNGDGVYSALDGDVPEMKGDQMLWKISNDIASPHNETNGNPMGVEIQKTFYSYVYEEPEGEYDDLINYQTFMNVRITNRSSHDYDSVFIGLFANGDIGNPMDDQLGSVVNRSSMVFYNGDFYDEDYEAFVGFKEHTINQTITFLESPTGNVPNNQSEDYYPKVDKIISTYDPALDVFYQYAYPSNDNEFYYYLNGHWKDGTPLYFGGLGHEVNSSSTPCDYYCPGFTDPNNIGTNGQLLSYWTAFGGSVNMFDVSGIMSSGPLSLAAGESTELEILFGYLTYNHVEDGHLCDFHKLDSLINWYENDKIPSNYLAAIEAGNNEVENRVKVDVYPNPFTDNIVINLNEEIEHILILNNTGQIIANNKPHNRVHKYNFKGLPRGVYYLKIKCKSGNFVKKVIKI